MLKGLFNNIERSRKLAANKKMLVSLDLQTQQLTRRDMTAWRSAWQAALNIDNPSRYNLYSLYVDTLIDNHLSGAIEQRKDMTLQKAFRIVNNKDSKEKIELTQIFESAWFKKFMSLALDSRFWGHSLIELGEVITADKHCFSSVSLVPRQHVIPSYGVIVKSPTDEWKSGISYREGKLAKWVIEAGDSDDLGLLLKVTPQAISKRYMLAYWDTFGEIFGMPIRIAKTSTRDKVEQSKIFNILEKMGARSYALLPEGTDIELKETSRGDAFNVYDKRVERADAEMSKCILGQTMTTDDGSSKAQGEVHLDILKNIVSRDADFVKDLINDQLIPLMVSEHGFNELSGYHFEWDEAIDFTPDQQREIEQMLLNSYEIDPKYFIDKYNIDIIGKKEVQAPALSKGFFD